MSLRRICLIGMIVMLSSVLLSSCTDPKEARRQFLLTEMRQLEHNYALVAQDMASKQQHVGFLQNKLQQQRSELSDYRRQVEAYISNHKLAVAALAAGAGGAAVAYDPNNEFSDEARGTAALVGLVAGFYALSNHEEVLQVADQLMQADRYVTQLEAAIVATQAEISVASEPINQIQSSLGSMQTTYNAYKTELESLR